MLPKHRSFSAQVCISAFTAEDQYFFCSIPVKNTIIPTFQSLTSVKSHEHFDIHGELCIGLSLFFMGWNLTI